MNFIGSIQYHIKDFKDLDIFNFFILKFICIFVYIRITDFDVKFVELAKDELPYNMWKSEHTGTKFYTETDEVFFNEYYEITVKDFEVIKNKK